MTGGPVMDFSLFLFAVRLRTLLRVGHDLEGVQASTSWNGSASIWRFD